jgi:pyruvate carboxylase subunit B
MAFDVEIDGEAYLVKVAPAGMSIQEAQPKAPTDGVTVPMQGVVIRYNVKKGDKVAKGDAVAVLEAMKMENNVLANKDGMIKEIYVKEGTTVTPGDVLMSID